MHKDERLGRDSVMEVARLRLGGLEGGGVESYYATPVLLVPHPNLLVVGSEK